MILFSAAGILLIPFSLGAFLKGAADMGTLITITTAMLVGLGYNPLYVT